MKKNRAWKAKVKLESGKTARNLRLPAFEICNSVNFLHSFIFNMKIKNRSYFKGFL